MPPVQRAARSPSAYRKRSVAPGRACRSSRARIRSFEIRTPTAVAAVPRHRLHHLRARGWHDDGADDRRHRAGDRAGTGRQRWRGSDDERGRRTHHRALRFSRSTAPNLLRFGMTLSGASRRRRSVRRACGVVLPGPTVVRQIPGCLASDAGSDPQLVDVPNAGRGHLCGRHHVHRAGRSVQRDRIGRRRSGEPLLQLRRERHRGAR